MKKFLSGKNRAQPDISAPYPQSSLAPVSADPRNPPPPQLLYRADQPLPQHSQPLQPDLQNPLNRSPSVRRASQQQQLDQQQQQPPPIAYQQPGIPQQIIPSHEDRPQDYRNSYIPPPGVGLGTQPPEREERRRFRDILGLGGNRQSTDQLGGRSSGVTRTVSIRGKGSPNPDKFAEESQRPQWTKQNNSSQLLSPTEEDEDASHNQFIAQQQQRQYGGRPPVPIKDSPQDQVYQQQQDYYPPPGTLQQPPPNQQFPPGGELYLTPEQQQQYQQHLQQQGQFVGITEQQLQQLQNQHFQHYPPPQGLQGHSHPTVPPPGFVVPGTEQLIAQQQQQSQLQQSPDEEQGQLNPPSGHPSQQTEIHQPHPTRLPTGQASSDKLFLQAPQGSAGQSPPSPFPGQTQSESQTLPPVQPPSPTSTQQSAPSPMPPPSRSGGTQREGKSMHSSSRESSMTAQQPGGPPGAQGQPYRGQGGQQEVERGRTTPSSGPIEMTEEDVAHYHQVMKDHKELKEKYQKVKKYYFEKESQVHQLQNTLANQRLSASRTSLDDSEYNARFERLAGLMAQLAFSIRKSWKQIPEWLHRAVNKDAMVTGKQEMTAVGRAYLSWWLYLQVFERIFHPDVDVNLSMALKNIVTNIRRAAPPVHSAEEEEALSAKISAWRMGTVEGLSDLLRSNMAQQNRGVLVQTLNDKLINDISAYLIEPAPPDLAGGVYMIVELAVNIAVHLPVESREVCIEYYPPMAFVSPDFMRVETGIPALTNPIAPPNDNSPSDSTGSDSTGGGPGGKNISDDHSDKGDDDNGPAPPAKDEPSSRRTRGGLLTNLMGGNSGPPGKPGGAGLQQPPQQGPGPNAKQQGGPGSKSANGSGRETPTPGQTKEERVRLAIGLGVVIRNRSVLVKAPVYTTMI